MGDEAPAAEAAPAEDAAPAEEAAQAADAEAAPAAEGETATEEAPAATDAETLGLTGDPEEDAAAAKLQAMQRGRAARREVAGKKIEKELGLTGSPEEQEKIAKLQAIQRGKAARKAMAIKTEEGAAAPETAAEEVAAIEQLTTAEESAAIEALYAGLALDDDGKAAATELLKALAEPADDLKEFATAWTDMLSGAAEATDSMTKDEFVLMAGRSKAFAAEEEDAVFEGTEEEMGAAAKIQAMHRGKLARAELDADKAAITKIQSIQRGKQSRRAEGKKKAGKAHIGKAEAPDLLKVAFESMDTSSKASIAASDIGVYLSASKNYKE